MSKETYNQFYKKYGANIHLDPERFLAISKLCQGKVLDIGCGTGDLADFYKGEYVGWDISNIAIKLAQKIKRPNATFQIADVTLPFDIDDYPFDTIVMAELLEHIKDDYQIFKNIERFAKGNARLIISVPNGDRVPDPNHLREFTVPELRKRFSPYGKVKFHRWSGFEQRILMTIDLGQKNENLLSVAMMVKDEEMGLEEAVLSCIEFTDNIVIAVDNKSQDKTLETAKRYADTLKHFDWIDDFAAIRNLVQEEIKTKWTLALDGHEYVKKCEGLEEMLKLDFDGLFVQVEMDTEDVFYTNRIYRSHLRWKNAIHNAISTKRNKKYKEFRIKHNRREGQSKEATQERWEQRAEMMPRLLKKEIKKNRKNARPIFYLARWYLGRKKLRKAIKYYKKYLKLQGPKGERWYVCWEASVAANGLEKHLLALKFLRKAEQEVPNRWETARHIGLTYMFFEQWEKAIIFLTDSFKINTGDFAFMPEQKDNAETWDLIGFCWFQQKQYTKAKISWEESIKNDKDEARIKLNKKRIELIDRNLTF